MTPADIRLDSNRPEPLLAMPVVEARHTKGMWRVLVNGQDVAWGECRSAKKARAAAEAAVRSHVFMHLRLISNEGCLVEENAALAASVAELTEEIGRMGRRCGGT